MGVGQWWRRRECAPVALHLGLNPGFRGENSNGCEDGSARLVFHKMR